MASPKKLTKQDIAHLAKLANLTLSEKRLLELVDDVTTTFDYVNTLQATDTSQVAETNQVTGLTNIFRDDVVDESRMLSQKEALSGAKHTHNGYFLVPAILE